MALRKIFTGDAPCLRKVCRPVENFDKGLLTLLDDMAETMYDAEGVGLAAAWRDAFRCQIKRGML